MKFEDRKTQERLKSDEGVQHCKCRERQKDETRVGGGLIQLTLHLWRIKAAR